MTFDINTKGIYPIAPTPFHPDGRLDTDSIDRLIDFYAASGATGVTILGIMGGALKLEIEEATAIVRQVVARY